MKKRKDNNITNKNSKMNNENECNICYDVIGERNCCVTECGHKFCFKCIATSMQYRNTCPCCRASILETPNDSEEELYEDDDAISLISTNELNMTEEEDNFSDIREFLGFTEADVEDVTKKLQENNITMLDMVSLYLNRHTSNEETTELLINKVHQIVVDADNEEDERLGMMSEDIASMSIELSTHLPSIKMI